MNNLKEIGTNIRDGWLSLSSSKRKKLIGVVSVAAVLLIILAYYTQRKNYTVLFSNLEEADAGAIVEDLDSQSMSYRLEDDGRTILIEEEEIDNYRINLAVDGLMPENSMGFEIFDDTSMMATDDDRQIMYQRAVQGELERSISSLQQVEAAQVTLSLPEDSIFQNPEYQNEASASVMVDTRGNGEITPQVVQGIASLVSGAVDNLPASNIQIIDTNGNLVSRHLESGESDFGTSDVATYHQQLRRNYEQDIEQKVVSLLAPLYGNENFRVNVSASMNFDAIEGERTEFTAPMTDEEDPDPEREGLIRSQTESFNGASDMLQGLIEDGEIPVAEDGEVGENNSLETVTNYELDEVTERYVQAPGVLEGISAQVIVNQDMGAAATSDQIEGIVTSALGLENEELSGEVVFNSIPFADETDEGLTGGDNWFETLVDFLLTAWPYMIGAFILLVVGLVLLAIIKRNKEEEFDEDLFPEEESTTIEPEDKETDDPTDVINTENAIKEQQNTVTTEKEDLVREQAKESPELAAELMKIWLKE